MHPFGFTVTAITRVRKSVDRFACTLKTCAGPGASTALRGDEPQGDLSPQDARIVVSIFHRDVMLRRNIFLLLIRDTCFKNFVLIVHIHWIAFLYLCRL